MLLGTAELTSTALLLTTFGLLLLSCTLPGRAIQRFGVPVVFLFLGVGMLAGSEAIGGIPFDDYRLAFRIGIGALILILLDAGLNTPLSSIREYGAPAMLLATVGVVITAALVCFYARYLGMSWSEATLLGAVVSSTDAAAIFAVLRGTGLRLRPRVAGTIELESGLNDPMAVILTVAAASVFLTPANAARLTVEVIVQLVVGLGAGLGAGFGTRLLLRRVRLPLAGLYPVVTLAVGLLTFGVATLLHGSGFLAVFAAAVVLGDGALPHRSALSRIHGALGWLSQVTMFLVLGLLVYPSQLWPIAWDGLLVGLFVSFIARPIAVAVCLAPFRYSPGEILYIGWVGLRGAVPIILAIYPVLLGVPGAIKVFNVVFFVVVMSALIPGVTIGWLTRKLGLEAQSEAPRPAAILEVNATQAIRGELLSFYIREPLAVCGAPLAEIAFPPDAGAALIIRDGAFIATRATTVLQHGDHVYIFCAPHERPFMELLFGAPQD